MLRVAVPNKGALSEAAAAILSEAGYRRRSDAKDLTVLDNANEVEFFFLRPKDIALYVGSGELDMGITGRDLALDSGAEFTERLALGFGRSTFRYAGPAGREWAVADLDGKRVATSYPNLVRRDLAQRGLDADLIADVVESGRSLRQNNLVAFGESLCDSEGVLIERVGADSDRARDQLTARLKGVVFGRQYVMLDYDCPRPLLEGAIAVTPGLESPTVAPMADDNWVAVRAMVLRKDANGVMDDLAELGAKAILMTDIRSCRF